MGAKHIESSNLFCVLLNYKMPPSCTMLCVGRVCCGHVASVMTCTNHPYRSFEQLHKKTQNITAYETQEQNTTCACMVGTLRPEICFVIYVITTYCVASRQPLSCLSAGFRQFAILHSEMNRAVETYMNMYNSRLTQQTFDCTYMNMQRLKDACRFTIILFAFAHRKYASENSCEIRFSFQIGDAISRRSLIGRLRNWTFEKLDV